MMKMAKQHGSTECGLYAIATSVCLALGGDLTTAVLDQAVLRSTLGAYKGTFGAFPDNQNQRITQNVIKEQSCAI